MLLPEEVAAAVGIGLSVASGQYQFRPGGVLQYDGARPPGEWHAHGYFAVDLGTVETFVFKWLRLRKRRWRCVETGATCHSRPPDALVSCRFSATVVVLVLWAWLDGPHGLQRCREPVAELDRVVSPRTVQRWLRRALPHALDVQQAARAAVIERSEPRPVEHWFPGGLSPPAELVRRDWTDPQGVAELWRGLAFLIRGAFLLEVPVTRLLAEARGRCHPRTDRFPI